MHLQLNRDKLKHTPCDCAQTCVMLPVAHPISARGYGLRHPPQDAQRALERRCTVAPCQNGRGEDFCRTIGQQGVQPLGHPGFIARQDHGIGMSPEVMGRIFHPFERGVPAGHYGGLGLGLYITRQIIEALGGTVSVRSAPGAGATFTVELPRQANP